MSVVQLNKLQLKAEILTVISKLQSVNDPVGVDAVLGVLLHQDDKQSILQILIKELLKANEQKAVLVCYLLLRLCPQPELEKALWDVLKNSLVSDIIKSIVINLLKDMGNKIDYDQFNEYFANPEEVIDADTKKLLNAAIINPEAQIDFLDFLSSLSDADKMILVQSMGDDYTSDALANILAPLFLYESNSTLGKIVVDILGTTKSQLALHALLGSLNYENDSETVSLIKKNISALKISGVREDNTIDFYKNILSNSKPYKSFTSYPDGHGNQALIFSRIRENETIQIVATVISDKWGLVDCFGFNEISIAEFERIVGRFYSEDEHVPINHPVLKVLLEQAEDLTRKTDGKISYEYICWKTLLSDISSEPLPIGLILANKFQKQNLSDEDLERVFMFDFIQRWFLDTDYNPEFKQFIENINKKLAENDFKIDFEALATENLNEIFPDEERNVLDKRLLMSSYLKYLAGDDNQAQILYSLYFDDENKIKLAQNIIRKSIYEYYVGLKFKQQDVNKMTNIFTLKNKPKAQELTSKQIDLAISIIESLWVKNA